MSQSDTEVACLTVRLGAIAENYRVCRRMAGRASVAGVVKANGYGLGADEVTRTLIASGCDTLFVARLDEGVKLRPVAPDTRIFVLDGAYPGAVPALIAHRLIPVLNSLAEIETWSAAARASGTKLEAALHFDTGMNRLGLPSYELATLVAESAVRLRGIRLVLNMSHLAFSEDSASAMNRTQLDRFRAGLARLRPAPASFSSTGGVVLGKDYAFDMVRLGIGLYGGNPQSAGANPFTTTAVLTGRILQLRRVDKGESVGYGASFRVGRKGTLATIALGYADGLMRAIGNRGMGAIAGVRAAVAGRVSMDLITLDVTDVPQAALHVGAEVEFLGDTIGLDELARAANTAPYEILTSLGGRVPRRYVGEVAR
ncbi:MAG: alanine racemase [Rhizomicrobium sp.]|jgi:alanine racemase